MIRIGKKRAYQNPFINPIYNLNLTIDNNNILTFINNLKSPERAKFMKLQTTRSNIKRNFCTVLTAGYCELQYLLNYYNAFAYSAGLYGWACDYYKPSTKYSGVCIATGYNTERLGGKRINYELVKEYEQKARELVLDYSQINKREALNNLIDEFIEKALAEKSK